MLCESKKDRCAWLAGVKKAYVLRYVEFGWNKVAWRTSRVVVVPENSAQNQTKNLMLLF